MPQRIESKQNPRYKRWQAVVRGSKKSGQVFLEGQRLCADALAAGVAVDVVLQADTLQPAAAAWLETLPDTFARCSLPDSLFEALSGTRHPQGVALICASPLLERPQAPAKADGLYLVADGIGDPGNLGTMIRTADAFAFDGVLVTSGTVWPLNPKVLRATMGAAFHVPLLAFEDLADVVKWLSGADLPLFAADPGGDRPPETLPGRGAILVGSEAHGISRAAAKLAQALVSIPMPGRAESLNAATAAAICAYAMMRQKIQANHECREEVQAGCK